MFPSRKAEYNRAWRQANRGRHAVLIAAWAAAHPDRIALKHARYKHSVADNAEYLRTWWLPCACCGEDPAGGVDRIDSSRPYGPGNMQPLCTMCNYAKNKKSQAEFLYWRAQVAATALREQRNVS